MAAARGFLFLMFLAALANDSKAVEQSNGGVVSDAVEVWCVVRNKAENVRPDLIQRALNWVCGEGGADCEPIQQGGPCYDPNDITRTASYAFNDYFLNHGFTNDSCNFDHTAALTSINPSHGNCTFPSRSIVSNGMTSRTMGFSPTSWGNLWTLFTVNLLLAFIFYC